MNTAKSLFCSPATLLGEFQKEKPMKRPVDDCQRDPSDESDERLACDDVEHNLAHEVVDVPPVVLEGALGDEEELRGGGCSIAEFGARRGVGGGELSLGLSVVGVDLVLNDLELVRVLPQSVPVLVCGKVRTSRRRRRKRRTGLRSRTCADDLEDVLGRVIVLSALEVGTRPKVVDESLSNRTRSVAKFLEFDETSSPWS